MCIEYKFAERLSSKLSLPKDDFISNIDNSFDEDIFVREIELNLR